MLSLTYRSSHLSAAVHRLRAGLPQGRVQADLPSPAVSSPHSDAVGAWGGHMAVTLKKGQLMQRHVAQGC